MVLSHRGRKSVLNDGKKIDFMVRLLEFTFLGLGSLEPKFSESQFSYFYGGDTSSATFPLFSQN